MFNPKKTKIENETEKVIEELRIIFTKIFHEEEREKLNRLKSQFTSLSNFRLKNNLKLLEIDDSNVDTIISKILIIFNSIITSSKTIDFLKEFNSEIYELENYGNKLSSSFNLGTDLKSIFSFELEIKELEDVLIQMYENIGTQIRSLSNCVVEKSSIDKDSILQIKTELNYLFFILHNSTQFRGDYRRDFVELYSRFENIDSILSKPQDIGENKIQKLEELDDKIGIFLRKYISTTSFFE